MRINGLKENQHVFKVPSGSPDEFVAGERLVYVYLAYADIC